MGGLNLEAFLHLLRADLAAWGTLGMIVLVMSLMTWTSWGSRRALRKCLVLSLMAHGGLVLYGSTMPSVQGLFQPRRPEAIADQERIRNVEIVAPEVAGLVEGPEGAEGVTGRRLSPWDRPTNHDDDGLTAQSLRPIRVSAPAPKPDMPEQKPPDASQAAPGSEGPRMFVSETREAADAQTPNTVAPADPEIEAPKVAERTAPTELAETLPTTLRPPTRERPPAAPEPATVLAPSRADLEVSRRVQETERHEPDRSITAGETSAATDAELMVSVPRRNRPVSPDAVPLNEPVIRSTPRRPREGPVEVADRRPIVPTAIPVGPATPSSRDPSPAPSTPRAARPIHDVPEVYRPRLDPDRSVRALRAGASPAGEQAVERALDWLARHQDADGRWNGGTAKYADGSTARGEESFTVHCPPGEVCFGECFYAEADTALTGLALLAYLGAGYSHLEGKYAGVVARGLDFLMQSQKADGDLRGPSRAVGMYCHAMAALALSEAYALTGDRRLRSSVERAVDFITKARAADGAGWRYLPGDQRGGDTSILGWVVMVLKSAREVGVNVPPEANAAATRWLDKVASGTNRGLASYQPANLARSKRDGEVSPTMTAEAWVCRQFLGFGGPGPASDEAAEYLLATHDTGSPMNLYDWYYGTLAMFQHGGEPWSRWNALVRDRLVQRQHARGHMAGSWDPDETDYGARGGRVYGTALATLTLEVYYRYLRLYDAPATPIAPRDARPTADPVRRTSTGPR